MENEFEKGFWEVYDQAEELAKKIRNGVFWRSRSTMPSTVMTKSKDYRTGSSHRLISNTSFL